MSVDPGPPAASAPLDLLPRGKDLGSVRLTRDAVLAAAPSAPDGSADVASVNVGGRLVRAYEVVALAVGQPTTRISIRQALRALHDLGFPVDGAGEQPPRTAPQRAAPPPPTDETDPDAGPALDPVAARELRRYPGRWVAVRGRTVAAHAPTLAEVLEQAQPSAANPATVLWVPRGAQDAAGR